MNRRQLLKLLAAAGTGSVVSAITFRSFAPESFSFFVVTSSPSEDLTMLKHQAGLSELEQMHISVASIQPATQDLSLIRNGQLIDPTREIRTAGALSDFATMLRARRDPGRFLLTVAPKQRKRGDMVVFERDGVLYDQISIGREYYRIVMPGEVGNTTFGLKEGRLSVVEASCRHELCRKVGALSHGHIICAPNRIVAHLPASHAAIDAITA